MKKKRTEPFDPDLVGFAAKRMQIGEFKFFQEAYLAWYGDVATEELIDPYFSRYLTNSTAPFWVRHYARNFLSDPEVRIEIATEKKIALVTYLGSIILEYAFIMCCYLMVR